MNLDPYIRHGWSINKMAKLVGISRQALQQRLARKGITGAMLRANRYARLRSGYDPTQSLSHNATRLKVSRGTLLTATKDLRKRPKLAILISKQSKRRRHG